MEESGYVQCNWEQLKPLSKVKHLQPEDIESDITIKERDMLFDRLIKICHAMENKMKLHVKYTEIRTREFVGMQKSCYLSSCYVILCAAVIRTEWTESPSGASNRRCVFMAGAGESSWTQQEVVSRGDGQSVWNRHIASICETAGSRSGACSCQVSTHTRF